MKKILLGLGSNVGNREENIKNAINLLSQNQFVTIKKVASNVETEAVSPIRQRKFINTAVQIETILTPEELLKLTQSIEKALGRTEKGGKQPRTIDIDLLLYDQDIICSEDLTIPHPMMHERSFVLIPLNEIASDVVHPILQEPISKIYCRVVGY